ncbi:MAG: hypothetical protein ABS942_07785 [Solibacillus sp.]|uniref:hypothetical protein n=1 Tax=Solibacillus sp. TaxID=1909654 RepID=UPI0033152C61
MTTSNYGKYPVPTLLQQVILFQQQLSEQGLLPYAIYSAIILLWKRLNRAI